MNTKPKKIACIGIGGTGVYYVARYFIELGYEVYGYDSQRSPRVEDIEKRGARIIIGNPEGTLEKDTDLFVYSPALPNEIITTLELSNPTIQKEDVGAFTQKLITQHRNHQLTEKELTAFKKSEIAPLFTVDQSKMTYIAITGTDGKTTTTTMIYHILKTLGYKPGLISTISAKIGDETLDTGFHTTTPTAQDLYKFISLMEEAHCTHAIIETTSHGLAMGRLAGLRFDAIGYTDITSDHLDYHKTWENYFTAKSLLITEHAKQNAFVVFKEDNTKVANLLKPITLQTGIRYYTYGESPSATIQATNITESPTISFSLAAETIHIPILGRYNVMNSLCAISLVAHLLKVSPKITANALQSFTPITGRMQILLKEPFTVIVDFAHTANALEVTLPTAASLKKNENNKLIHVFGCAGKRDQTKRIPMGKISAKFADITILTAEDPRSEKLSDINEEIQEGWKDIATKNKHLIRFDDDSLLTEVRRKAIKTALELAKPGDVVFISGKAHEESLCFGTTEYPWNDIAETTKLLEH